MKGAYVSSVDKGSIADDLKIKEGDLILSINGKEIVDYLDYKFLASQAKSPYLFNFDLSIKLFSPFACDFYSSFIIQRCVCVCVCV